VSVSRKALIALRPFHITGGAISPGSCLEDGEIPLCDLCVSVVKKIFVYTAAKA
jgi:hypothetical protein